jgi:hypothetical protein
VDRGALTERTTPRQVPQTAQYVAMDTRARRLSHEEAAASACSAIVRSGPNHTAHGLDGTLSTLRPPRRQPRAVIEGRTHQAIPASRLQRRI